VSASKDGAESELLLPVAGLMCDTLVIVLFWSPAAEGGWFSVTLEIALFEIGPLPHCW
jgi:hypothetical protein